MKEFINYKLERLNEEKNIEEANVIDTIINKNNKKENMYKIINLHGLTLKLAKIFFPKYMDERISEFIKSKKRQHRLRVITGKGINSPGAPVLKPYVEQYLINARMEYEDDDGSYVVIFKE